MYNLVMRHCAPTRSSRRGGGHSSRRTRPRAEVLEVRVVPSSGDWSMYNLDPAGTRDNTAESTLSADNVSGLHQLWDFPTAGIVTGTPAVVDNVAYAGDTSGMFYAVRASDGKLLWKAQVNGEVTDSPLVTDGTVIFGTQGNATASPSPIPGAVYGLDAHTGAVRWQVTPDSNPAAQIWGSATMVGKNVAIGVASGDEINFDTPPFTARGSLALLDPHNGHIIWQTFTVSDADYARGANGAAIWSTPAYDPATNIIYATTGNNYSAPATSMSDAMVAFNATTGQVLWSNQATPNDTWTPRFPLGPDFDFGDSPHIYQIAVNGQAETVVGAGQKSGFYHVYNAMTGAEIDKNQLVPGSTLGGLFATAAVDPRTGVVFANANDAPPPANPTRGTGDLFAISGDGSQTLWAFPTPRGNLTGVALANGVVYFVSLGGTMYALDEATGALLAQVSTGGGDSGPAVSNGRIFLGQGDLLSGNFKGGIVAFGLSTPHPTSSPYLQTNLVSDLPGLAQVQDPSLVNPWGVSFGPTGPFWVSNQGTSTATIYSVTPSGVTKLGLTVDIPTTASGPQGPTGQVHNGTSSFLVNGNPAVFIFADLNGTISAWNGGQSAATEWTTPGAVYTGLAIATNTSGSFLYAADGAQDRIDVYDGTFTPYTGFGSNAFVDPSLPKGLVPFNIQFLNGNLFVTYAPAGHAAQVNATPGQGAVAVFKTNGQFIEQLIAGGPLASPWGITLAPAGFGTFGGDLLVGNFAFNDGVINAFDPSTGAFRGTLTDASGRPIFNQALWSLTFGNGVNGGDPNTLYFTAGIDGETHGLFGSIQAVPPLSPKAPIVPNLPDGAFQSLTTVPANGDVNPYGVAFVPQGFPTGGILNPGDILVSNFNNSTNAQGTGTTIVDIAPNGSQTLFYQGPSTPGQLGLTTALGVLRSGFVIVGSLPTLDGTSSTIQMPGSLLILDRYGRVVDALSDGALLDGPWDLTVNDQGNEAQVFVSDVLSGVVTRIDLEIPRGGNPIVEAETRIASGYLTRTDPAALVVGPTGLAYDARRDVLYVASTGDNAIFAIPNAADRHGDAGMGHLVYQDPTHLHGPLGLVLAPNGDLITTNGDAVNPDPNQSSEIVEFTPSGHFVGELSLDPGPGAAFGLAVTDVGGVLRLAAVDDATNTLDVWTFETGVRSPGSHRGDSDRGGSPSGAALAGPGTTGSGDQGGTSAIAAPEGPSSGRGMSPAMGGNAAAVDQLFLAIQEEELSAALFGQPDGTGGRRKNPSGPWTG